MALHGWIEDAIIIRIAASFPCLEQLQLSYVTASKAGIEAISRLNNLRILYLSGSQIGEMDDEMLALTKCTQLQKLIIPNRRVHARFWIRFLLMSPRCFSYFAAQKIESPAAELLHQLRAIGPRSLTVAISDMYIRSSCREVLQQDIWQSEGMQDALDQLKERDGVDIKIEDNLRGCGMPGISIGIHFD